MTIDNGSGFPAPGNVDQYHASSTQKEGMLAAAAGYRWTQQAQAWLPAVELALRYQYLFPQSINGSVTQFSLSPNQDYAYHWTTDVNIISLFTKLDLISYKKTMLYVDVGVGSAFVHAHDYQETAYPGVTPRISPAFANRTSSQWSYNVGAGIDISLSPQLIGSVGYDYQSLGDMTSGPGQTTWSGSELHLGRFGLNTALISLTYLFDHPLT